MHGPAPVAPRCLLRFRLAVHPAPAADDALDVLGGTGPAGCEQSLFGLRRRDAGQRSNFRVRELAARQRLRQPWQGPQRARHADALASRAPIEADTPREPRGARGEAGVPAAAGVELSDEIQQARGGRVQVGGQFGDLIAKPMRLQDERWWRAPRFLRNVYRSTI